MGQNQVATCKNPIILWQRIRNAETGCFYAICFSLEERTVVMESSSLIQVGEHVFRGVLLMIASCLLAPLFAAVAFYVSCTHLSWAFFARAYGAFAYAFLRAVFDFPTFFFITAISVMPLADALAIVFIEPFLILLFGKFVLGETVGVRRLGACIVGFGGVLLVIQPSFAAFGYVALLPLIVAFSFAFYMLLTRSLSAKMDVVSMQFQTANIGTIVCVPALFLGGAFSIEILT